MDRCPAPWKLASYRIISIVSGYVDFFHYYIVYRVCFSRSFAQLTLYISTLVFWIVLNANLFTIIQTRFDRSFKVFQYPFAFLSLLNRKLFTKGGRSWRNYFFSLPFLSELSASINPSRGQILLKSPDWLTFGPVDHDANFDNVFRYDFWIVALSDR